MLRSKKGRVKKVYLPEGEWIDFNNKQTKYSGGQSILFDVPLNIPMFVKRLNNTYDACYTAHTFMNKRISLYVHIFPDNIGRNNKFWFVLKNNGEDLGYLKRRILEHFFNVQQQYQTDTKL